MSQLAKLTCLGQWPPFKVPSLELSACAYEWPDGMRYVHLTDKR